MRSAPDTRQGLRSMRAAEIFKEKQGRRSASAARSSQPQSQDLFYRMVLISPAAPSSFEPSDPVSFARLLCDPGTRRLLIRQPGLRTHLILPASALRSSLLRQRCRLKPGFVSSASAQGTA